MFFYEASRSAEAQACDCKCYRLWVPFALEEIKYFIISFTRSGKEAKRGVSSVTQHAQCLRNSAETGERMCLNGNEGF